MIVLERTVRGVPLEDGSLRLRIQMEDCKRTWYSHLFTIIAGLKAQPIEPPTTTPLCKHKRPYAIPRHGRVGVRKKAHERRASFHKRCVSGRWGSQHAVNIPVARTVVLQLGWMIEAQAGLVDQRCSLLGVRRKNRFASKQREASRYLCRENP
jgi:hypothetical protein